MSRDCSCALSVSASTIRLGQDQLSGVLESGIVRIFWNLEVPKVEHRGKTDHGVNPGGEEGKYAQDGGGGCSHLVGADAPKQYRLQGVVSPWRMAYQTRLTLATIVWWAQQDNSRIGDK